MYPTLNATSRRVSNSIREPRALARKLVKLSTQPPSLTFGNVSGDGSDSPSDLLRERVKFVCWKTFAETVDVNNEIHRFLPSNQISMRFNLYVLITS